MDFFALHGQPAPLLLANAWDVPSVRAAVRAGYAAVGTSSAAMAATLGYEDGEQMGFAELHGCVKRMIAACPLPLSVDMEAGYARDPSQAVANLMALAELGVAGVNLEDSCVRNGKRLLQEAEGFAGWLQAVKAGLQRAGGRLFLNIRTDAFLLGRADAQAETIARGRRYAEHGADGLFVPGVTREADIAAIASAVPLPLNVMCMPALPSFERLAALGVRRISMGNFVHAAMERHLRRLLGDISAQQSFRSVFADADH